MSIASNLERIISSVGSQAELIAQIKTTLDGKASGGGGGNCLCGLPQGYKRIDYIQFSGKQIVDTGIVCNQNTKIQTHFTRGVSSQEYLFGVASSGNTASVTAYLGGSWRFGNKYDSKSVATVNQRIGYDAYVDKSRIDVSNDAGTISGVNDFETVGTLLIGSCRSASGAVGAAQFDGKITIWLQWEGDELLLKLLPVVSEEGVYRFWDDVGKKFHDSITDTPLEGGNF